jgi:predicted Fe-Mo cluster-binding NifX family protein
VKVCFPVLQDDGINGTIYGHFASTPLFSIIDTTTGTSSTVKNCDKKNPDAGCNPFSALRGRQLDGIIVGGIGDDSLRTMNMCGFRVFEAQSASVAENLELLKNDSLAEATILNSHHEGRCGDEDGASHGCNHDHDHDDIDCDHDCDSCNLDCGGH